VPFWGEKLADRLNGLAEFTIALDNCQDWAKNTANSRLFFLNPLGLGSPRPDL